MINRASLRLAASTAVAAILLSPVAFADETTSELATNMRALESLTALGEQLKGLTLPDYGFSEQDRAHWASAVDVAFAPELLEADFISAFDELLTDETRAAALDFNRSPLGQETYELIDSSQPLSDEDGTIVDGEDVLNNASPDELALYVGLFESQSGEARANDVMDIYFRTMAIAAEPVVGAEAAAQWVASAQGLREGYVDNYFRVTVAVYSTMEQGKREELVTILKAPEMVAYAEQATEAVEIAMNAAVDRLETAYAEELEGN